MSYKEIREPPLSSSRIKRGGYEIRTREGVNPTRFPSERHRPLGESSAGELTASPRPGPIRASGARALPMPFPHAAAVRTPGAVRGTMNG